MNFRVKLICILISLWWFQHAVFAQSAAVRTIETQIIWEDDFSPPQKQKITVWLNEVSQAVFNKLGRYPFSVNLYLHLSDRGGEPVPWANTVRHGEQGVRFYVNPEFPLEGFQQDWTAPHELSHLSLPFLGRENMWFAEGYASFMQWNVLQEQGVLEHDVVNQKYREKLESAMLRYQREEPFPEISSELLSRHDYPAVYWGGACYFFQVNAYLQSERNTDLFAVIRTYQNSGRLKDDTLDEVVRSLDRISKSSIFSETLSKFLEEPSSAALQSTPIP